MTKAKGSKAKTKAAKGKKKISLSDIDRILHAMAEVDEQTEEEAISATLDAWGTGGPEDDEDLVFVPHVVRRTFGTAHAPLALVVDALRAAGAPVFTVTNQEKRTVQLASKTKTSYTLRPGTDDMLPWPKEREVELVKALLAENDARKHGLLATRAAWILVKA